MTLTHDFEEVKLVYHNKVRAKDRPKIRCPRDAADVLYHHWDKGQLNLAEASKLLLLDNQMRLMSIANLSFGGMTQTLVDPRMVFSLALVRKSHRLILGHNHPSGTLSPSRLDIQLTKNLQKLGKMLHVDLEDHLIITEEGYYSIISECRGTYTHGS